MTDSTQGGAAALSCHDAVVRLWDYLDGRLGPVDAAAVDAHLASCALCPPHFEFERAFLTAVAGARADAESVGGLRDRVVAALARDGFETP